MKGISEGLWISIKERFPDHNQKVIFYVKNRDESFCGFFQSYSEISGSKENRFYETLEGWWFEDEEITHWMPLPEPPCQVFREKEGEFEGISDDCDC